MFRLAGQMALLAGDTTRARDLLTRGNAHLRRHAAEPQRVTSDPVRAGLSAGRAEDLRLWFDSLFAMPNPPGQYQSMLGRLAEAGDTSEAGRQNTRWRRILVGVYDAAHDTLYNGWRSGSRGRSATTSSS